MPPLALRRPESHPAVSWAARAGLAARGLLWFVVGLLAVEVALGKRGTADKEGAFAAIKDQPLGQVLLIAVAAGFAAHAGFRLIEGTVGRQDEDDDRRRWLKRAGSLGRCVVYGSLAVSTVRFLSSGGSSEDAKGPTARVMSYPAGRWLVGVVGLAVLVVGLVQAVRGLRQDFTKKLDLPGGGVRTLVERVGMAGLVGRGLVYALIGGFLCQAAVDYQPSKAKGLDQALKAVGQQPFGTALLLATAIGLLAFSGWSFLEARYRSF